MRERDGKFTGVASKVGLMVPGSLLLLSGCCALVYQVCWLRQLRLVFGASTAANAVVLAIFMGGLGLGALRLGPRADRHARPLALYGRLELGIALFAAVSPFLIDGIRTLYTSLGGTPELGIGPGTLVRLALSAIVLGGPTFLMGGTLPAVVRAVQRSEDPHRRHLGVLYALNTLGSVGGALVGTFLAIEWWGIRQTLWIAVAVNVAVACVAIRMSRHFVAGCAGDNDQAPPLASSSTAPPRLVLTAAAVTGFTFLLMELVWYRVLAPLLGGSSYSFGMILAVALLGVGFGGLLYGAWARHWAPTTMAFAVTAILEAMFLAVPLALGDSFALFAADLRPIGAGSFTALSAVWFAVASAAILLPALVAGFQFPLLVGLLGRGDDAVGRHVGQAYAFNTLGAIAGSLAGGFGLIPLMGAVGAWRLMVITMAGVGVLAVCWGWKENGRLAAWVSLGAAVALAMASSPGPSAVWRHTAIGAGRSALATLQGVALQDRMQEIRRSILWETDGIESSIALQSLNGHAFVIHGKVDGHALGDAPTNLWLGLLPTLLHPNPEQVLVIGLGTGQTAGWAAAVPTVHTVDVVELEPAIARVASVCATSNHDVMQSPQVQVHYSDAREWLMVTPKKYDVIVSEPSNPYRAGIASLFSREFYQAARDRLGAQGLFLQWLQAYEVSDETLAIALATLHSVFPEVEVWEGASNGDLMLVASMTPVEHSSAMLSARLKQEPWRSGLSYGWRVTGLEGLYSGYVGGTALVKDVAAGAPINIDDHPVIEFGFARQAGHEDSVSVDALRARSTVIGSWQPPLDAPIDPLARLEARHSKAVAGRSPPGVPSEITGALAARMRARVAWTVEDFDAAAQAWDSQGVGPQGPLDELILGEIRAKAGDARALVHADRLLDDQPTEAALISAAYADAAGEPHLATQHLLTAFVRARQDPWVHPSVLLRGLKQALSLSQRGDSNIAVGFLKELLQSFAGGNLDEARRGVVLRLAQLPGMEPWCTQAFSAVEPFPHFHEGVLTARVDCYERTNHPLLPIAVRELARFHSIATRD
jgi:predicted membrane-bound spermidine synthase